MCSLPKHRINRYFIHRVPLRAVLIVPFVLQIFAAVGLVGYFSFKNGHQAVNDLAHQLIDSAIMRVNDQLDNYLSLPQQLGEVTAQAIATGQLNLKDTQASERYFWRQAKVFDTISYIGYTLADGTQGGAGRWTNGKDLLIYENFPRPGKASDYISDQSGNRVSLIQSYDFDPLKENNYIKTRQAKKPFWADIYAFAATNIEVSKTGSEIQATDTNSHNIGNYLDYVVAPVRYPLLDEKGEFWGSLDIELQLSHISKFLRQIKVSPSGQVFILERSGQLVASSGEQSILNQKKDSVERFTVSTTPDPLIKAVARHIQQQSGSLGAIIKNREFILQFHNQNQFVQVTPWKDKYGLDWLIVVAVPESDFMAQINANTRTTILLSLAALGIATLVGIYTSHWITRPILALHQASIAIAKGNLTRQVATSYIQELDTVGQSFNQMANQLQITFTALERSKLELEARVTERTQELSDKNTQLNATLAELHRTQSQMIQTEKMTALGQMVAGIAHEINNPVNFIHANLNHVNSYTQELLALVQVYQEYVTDPPQVIEELIEAIELAFICEDLPEIVRSMRVGTERIREIVLSLRNFSRLDEAEFKAVDLHEGINNTLLILRHRLEANVERPAIQIIKNYGNLPLVECYAGKLNQVLMNLLSNAIDALEEANLGRTFAEIENNPNTIWIHTTVEEHNRVKVIIADNGNGIAEKVRSRIFDPFFTTKPVGKGTGLGLAISYQIVTEKHNGKLYCDSTLGEGTKFCLEIPVKQPRSV
jgi:signal transduction histidine kinase